MRSSRNAAFLSGLIASLASFSRRHTSRASKNMQTIRHGSLLHPKSNPLLNISIANRLALGFLLPALIAVFTLSSVSMQSQQRFSQEATFYQNLLSTYTFLTTAADSLQEMHTHLLQTMTYTSQPNALPEVLADYQKNVRASASGYNTVLATYLQRDLIGRYPDLVVLFTEAGHAADIEQQKTYSQSVQMAWQTYRAKQEQVLHTITIQDSKKAQFIILQANESFADVERDLQSLIMFSGGLAPSLHDAARVEVQKLIITTIFAGLGLLAGIGLVGWLISSTLVERLKRLRSVVQAIAHGQVDARLSVEGRDEIADVSKATNSMVDTLVGLLEETRHQHDELAKGEELKCLHQALQQEHEALNEANRRLEALATIDPLTSLPNHRTIMARIEDELALYKSTSQTCAILFLDIDRFKRINDTWGHRAGDEILREVGKRLVNTVRREDFVGRYGGEEFAIVLINIGLEEAVQVAERLRAALAQDPCLWEAGEAGEQPIVSIPVTGSFGVSVYPQHGTTREALIEAADSAMYQAKRRGRNQVCVASDEFSSLQRQAKMHVDLQKQETSVVQALVAVANAHDVDTSNHARRMIQMVEATARQLGCSDEEVQLAQMAALLHDIGKIGIPDHILHKPGPLSEEEWSVMRRHPKIGHQILAQVGEKFEQVSHIVVAHHERWDGRGYPYGLSEDMIPLGARILSVADSYDAMTSDRPYRAALSEAEAQAELRNCAGHQFDPHVVEAFIRVLVQQKQGTLFPSLQSV